MAEPTETHYRIVAKAFAEARVIPLLGAGVNLCGRPHGTGWQQGQYLPSGLELAAHLARAFYFPSDEPQELLRVSQYAAVMTGSGPLYEELHRLLDADSPASRSSCAGTASSATSSSLPPTTTTRWSVHSGPPARSSTWSAMSPRDGTEESSCTRRRMATPSSSSGRTSTRPCRSPGAR
jgi:hypothetical protein